MSTDTATTTGEATASPAEDGMAPPIADVDEKLIPVAKPGSAASSVSIPKSTLIAATAATVLLVISAVLGGLLWSAKSELADNNKRASDQQHAEQIASDYSVGAATIKFDDINSWIGRLKNGTTPQLANKFDATAPKLEQILTPLKWTSTASPITAKLESRNGDIYKVNVFVNVSSTNAQNPDGAQTTVTYNVTLDKSLGWKITDVGGINAALPTK
ncbi:hypothetical protein [Nocardia vaccinii]|uniref:hypothetical protein n=1 Tax=Nocardia vaccinii TaxID=1822 RepID=UPI000A991FA1|nr:hypothetical protein [Nocardia vaccinii]